MVKSHLEGTVHNITLRTVHSITLRTVHNITLRINKLKIV
jgi:hypothetical protein